GADSCCRGSGRPGRHCVDTGPPGSGARKRRRTALTPQPDRSAVLDAWCRSDLARGVLRADRGAVHGSTSVRELIVDLVLSNGATDELFDACATLGRLFAQPGASPTLASATIDHLAEALSTP